MEWDGLVVGLGDKRVDWIRFRFWGGFGLDINKRVQLVFNISQGPKM
jgi:hypothetical protein